MESTAYTLPETPAGTAVIVRTRALETEIEFRRVEAGAEGSYSPHAPLQMFAAFGADGGYLGTWSPGYTTLGWDTDCSDLATDKLFAIKFFQPEKWSKIVAFETVRTSR